MLHIDKNRNIRLQTQNIIPFEDHLENITLEDITLEDIFLSGSDEEEVEIFGYGIDLDSCDSDIELDKIQSHIVINPCNNSTSSGDPTCRTTFNDGTIHETTIKNRMEIDYDIMEPRSIQYQTSVFTDKLYVVNEDKIVFGSDSARCLVVDNAGGASEYSEAMSMYYFENIYGGSNFILENEVKYWLEFKMVDYVCTIHDKQIGVSVTRAMGYPHSTMFTKEEAIYLIHKKIKGLIVACDLVIDEHSFTKSILHIWCQNQRIADVMKEVYEEELELDSKKLKVLCDVIVIITICDDKNIYTNRTQYKNDMLVIL